MITLSGLVRMTSMAPAQLPLTNEMPNEWDPVLSTRNLRERSYASHPMLAEKMLRGEETNVPLRRTREIPPSILGITLVITLTNE